MATQIEFRGDTRANLLLSTPVEREIGVDTTNDRLILGDGSTPGGIPQASYVDVQNNRFTYADAVQDSSGDYTVTLDDAPTAYAEGQKFTIKPDTNSIGATNININSLGEKDIQKDDGTGTLTELEDDDLKANIPAQIIYDGTKFILQQGGGGGELTPVFTTEITSSVSTVDLDDVFESGYNYRLYLNDVTVTNTTQLRGRVAEPSSGYASGGNDYAYVSMVSEASGGLTNQDQGNNGQSFINFTGGGDVGNSADVSLNGFIDFLAPMDDTSTYKCINWHLSFGSGTSDQMTNSSGSARYDNNGNPAIFDSFQFSTSAGNYDGGKLSLFRRVIE